MSPHVKDRYGLTARPLLGRSPQFPRPFCCWQDRLKGACHRRRTNLKGQYLDTSGVQALIASRRQARTATSGALADTATNRLLIVVEEPVSQSFYLPWPKRSAACGKKMRGSLTQVTRWSVNRGDPLAKEAPLSSLSSSRLDKNSEFANHPRQHWHAVRRCRLKPVGPTKIRHGLLLALLVLLPERVATAGLQASSHDAEPRRVVARVQASAEPNEPQRPGIDRALLRHGLTQDVRIPQVSDADRSDIQPTTAGKLAVARARQLWGGETAVISILPLTDSLDRVIAYDVDLRLDGQHVESYASMAQAWQQVLDKQDQRQRTKLSIGKGDVGTVTADAETHPFASVTVSATYDAYPIRAATRGLSNYYAVPHGYRRPSQWRT